MLKVSSGNEENNNCLEEATNYCCYSKDDHNSIEEFLRMPSRHSSPCSSVVSSSWSLVSSSLISLDEYETPKEQQKKQEKDCLVSNKKNRASSFIKRWIPSSHYTTKKKATEASSLADSFIDVPRALCGDDIQRYTSLFDAINDGNQVDGVTVKTIWAKSNLPKQILYQIWCQCDPMQRGVLDKNAFIVGMKKIDTILAQKNKKVV